jgi:predicted metal-dependent phosphoesterase TrpH
MNAKAGKASQIGMVCSHTSREQLCLCLNLIADKEKLAKMAKRPRLNIEKTARRWAAIRQSLLAELPFPGRQSGIRPQ